MRLIDVDRALEIVRDQGIAHPNAYHLTKYATLILREASTIEAEPVRHGRWEVNELGYLVCTNCAWVRYGIPLVEHFTYCPNCGCKMDKEE